MRMAATLIIGRSAESGRSSQLAQTQNLRRLTAERQPLRAQGVLVEAAVLPSHGQPHGATIAQLQRAIHYPREQQIRCDRAPDGQLAVNRPGGIAVYQLDVDPVDEQR